jgi:hypothetical protein
MSDPSMFVEWDWGEGGPTEFTSITGTPSHNYDYTTNTYEGGHDTFTVRARTVIDDGADGIFGDWVQVDVIVPAWQYWTGVAGDPFAPGTWEGQAPESIPHEGNQPTEETSEGMSTALGSPAAAWEAGQYVTTVEGLTHFHVGPDEVDIPGKRAHLNSYYIIRAGQPASIEGDGAPAGPRAWYGDSDSFQRFVDNGVIVAYPQGAWASDEYVLLTPNDEFPDDKLYWNGSTWGVASPVAIVGNMVYRDMATSSTTDPSALEDPDADTWWSPYFDTNFVWATWMHDGGAEGADYMRIDASDPPPGESWVSDGVMFAVVPGNTYTYMAWMRSTSGVTPKFRAEWLDQGGYYLTPFVDQATWWAGLSKSPEFTLTSSWQQYRWVLTVPAGAHTVQFYHAEDGWMPGQPYDIDKVGFYEGDVTTWDLPLGPEFWEAQVNRFNDQYAHMVTNTINDTIADGSGRSLVSGWGPVDSGPAPTNGSTITWWPYTPGLPFPDSPVVTSHCLKVDPNGGSFSIIAPFVSGTPYVPWTYNVIPGKTYTFEATVAVEWPHNTGVKFYEARILWLDSSNAEVGEVHARSGHQGDGGHDIHVTGIAPTGAVKATVMASIVWDDGATSFPAWFGSFHFMQDWLMNQSEQRTPYPG